MKNYAPVIIPTLCRYEHFKQCLESLESCAGAEYTDVYVALDYPPSEKYNEGWMKLDRYLTQKEKDNKFANLYIIKRNHNCGVFGEFSNINLLIKYITGISDRFIYTEDDNIFSPNFLEYINQGLEKYKEDPNCVSVCGYTYYGVDTSSCNNNIFLTREFSAWGVGFWTSKWSEVEKLISIEYLGSIANNWSKWYKIYRHEPRLLNTVLLNIACKFPFGDTVRVCHQYLEDKYSVFPKVSKVRNIGFDNSGTTIFKEDDNYNKQPIDESATFEMDDIEPIVLPEVQKEVERFFKRSWAMNVLVFVRMVIYNLTGWDICLRAIKKRNKALFK